MQTTNYIWQNGNFIPWHEAKTHVLTHSLHYGAAAFEGMRAYSTSKGPLVFRLIDHLKRLLYSASVVHMKLPPAYTAEKLAEITNKLIELNKLEECYIRPLVYYGYGKMGLNPENAPVDIIIACWPWKTYISADSIGMKTNKYVRMPKNSTIADAKLTGNYLNSILGVLQIKGLPYQETLFLDENGYIAEGPGENIFLVKDNTLYTPKLGAILPGITRDTVIKLAKAIGLQIVEADLLLEKAYHADEIFLTGTAIEIMPVHALDDQIIGDGKSHKVTQQLQKLYLDLVHNNLTSHVLL